LRTASNSTDAIGRGGPGTSFSMQARVPVATSARKTCAAIRAIADRLIAADDDATTVVPISAATLGFDIAAVHDVLREVEARRLAQGWRAVGRKIGFTNRTVWPLYQRAKRTRRFRPARSLIL
jgi:hypothetical protein